MKQNKNLRRSILLALLVGTTAWSLPVGAATSVVSNTALPKGWQSITGNHNIEPPHGNVLDIVQSGANGVIKWEDFSIGGSATVNFTSDVDNFNTLNYVNGGSMSQIYGALNGAGGNIYIVNPAGVMIGNSAEINVGSLHVANKYLDESKLAQFNGSNLNSLIDANRTTDSYLMSLGNINAATVTFEGDGRIVIDTERLKDASGDAKLTADNIRVTTSSTGNLVIGYDAYNEEKNTYAGANGTEAIATVNDIAFTKANGYMWVEDAEQLQAISTNLSGNYALRNAIDASHSTFTPLGSASQAFTGQFDGLDYSIFNLNIDTYNDNAGLFGYADGADIRNVTLVGGSISGGSNVGALVGMAVNNTTIANVTNSANVSGTNSVGGIAGKLSNSTVTDAVNTGTISGVMNVGGLIGAMTGGTLSGTSYNMGGVTGSGSNVGGIAGSATDDSDIGSDDGEVYNLLDVTGAYNVGGIVGSLSGSTVENVSNYGDVKATGYTTDDYKYHTANSSVPDGTVSNGVATMEVAVSNAGGIAGTASGSDLSHVYNEGDVTTAMVENSTTGDYYIGGNVGGIVGRGENTTIRDAENKENTVAGAHNVGGIAGYLTSSGDGKSLVSDAMNNGGDITATGARNASSTDFVEELVRETTLQNNEIFHVGNIGGIVGYLYDESTDTASVRVENASNRGTVHSAYFDGTAPETAEAANVGGIVGKLDSALTGTEDLLNSIVSGEAQAAVSDARNMGDVQGYTGVGGVIGMMYNGSVADSFNVGTVNTTRVADSASTDPLNMGGVVGDTTARTDAMAIIYNVYNAGQVGDETFTYYGRHVGGVVGRLSGFLANSYNTGDIYNGYSTVGGLVGYWLSGDITNVFNTGNITVVNHDTQNETTQVGGLIGAYGNGEREGDTLRNAYNLGTIRAYAAYNSDGGAATKLSVGGIIGNIREGGLTIENVYTTNNIYGAIESSTGAWTKSSSGVGQIVGIYNNGTLEDQTTIKNAYFVDMYKASSDETDHTTFSETGNQDATTVTDFDDLSQYEGFDVNDWRIYEGTTPILNEFMPSMGDDKSWNTGGWDVQYGTAYNPFLTIIEANGDNVVLDWGAGLLDREEGLAVYNGSLTINNMPSASLWGTIYAEGTLTINGTSDSDIHLGASANLYGESVTIAAGSGIEMHGAITSTDGDVKIEAEGDAEIIGVITSSEAGSTTTVSGIGKTFDVDNMNFGDLSKYESATASVGAAYGTTTSEAKANGDVSIAAGGRADVLYGNLGTGSITAHGDLSVSGEESVYIDSLLSINGDLHLESAGEMLIDLTNMGNKDTLHDGFLTHFTQEGDSNSTIHVKGDADNFKIMVDLWDEKTGSFKLDKYDTTHSLTEDLDALQVAFGNSSGMGARDYTYIWVSTGEQLAAIEEAASGNSHIYDYNFALKDNINASAVEDYTAIGSGAAYTGTFDGRGYNVIGLDVNNNTGNAGLFGTIGKSGVVKDLGIYSSGFTGSESAGAVAAVNKGTISNVTGFGNTVQGGSGSVGGLVGENFGILNGGANTGTVTAGSTGVAAGGLVGTNNKDATISSGYSDSAVNATYETSVGLGGVVGANDGTVESVDSLGVTHGTGSTHVGGIAGTNIGSISSAYNESIVTGKTYVGGIAGSNEGTIENVVNAASVTGDGDSEYIGGLVGTNSAIITDGRNNGVITGTTYVGGLVGANELSGELTNLTNDSSAAITGDTYVGGIAGSNAGTITADDGNELINRGTITGHTYVGGVAGVNAAGGIIENVNNDVELHVNTDVGGDAQYFGGVAGQNSGTITNATNQADLNAADASFVGGIVGQNTETGTLTGTIANEGSVSGGSAVAGVIGDNQNGDLLNNTSDEKLTIRNAGTVTATTGGAAGIIYTHSGAVNNVNLINSGTVTGHSVSASTGNESYTGGIFGIITGDITDSRLENQGTIEDDAGTVFGLGDATGGIAGKNTGTITGSVLVNTGTVSGAGNTGGIFGENTGKISTSSLINTGTVTGTGANTGGLIGTNSGNITGGSNGEWYEYQVYNTGKVSGTTNVGGLVGSNEADLTAGYNAGTVTGSTNVGGIAGTSSDGAIDQVFNTGSVGTSMSSAVGGLVGSLTGGTLTNGYSTAAAQGSNNVGNLVGTISGDTASGLINAAESGKAVGSGTLSDSYSFSSADSSTTGITYLTGDDKMDADKYGDLDFGESGEWKIYDGSSMPILEAFLTKLTVNDKGTGDVPLGEFLGDLIYNAKDQDISIKDLIEAGYITGPDDMYDPLTGKEVDALDAYWGSDESGDYGDRGLIFNTEGQVHVGTYSDWLASAQFAEDENGLLMGYDITLTANIDAYTLHVSLDDLWRIYGSALINGDENIEYEDLFHYLAEDMTNEMKEELEMGLSFKKTSDGSRSDENGKTTQDVGDYTWGGTVSLNGDVITIGDYVLSFTDKTGTTTTNDTSLDLTASAEVQKADLTIDLSDVDRTYGEVALSNDTKYDASFDSADVVNGDTLTIDLDILAELAQDGAIYRDAETGEWRTNDVTENGYTWTVNTEDIVEALNGTFNSDNYNITVNAGKSTVYARELNLGDILASIVYGNQDEKGLQISLPELIGVYYGDDVALDGNYSYTTTGEYESNRGSRDTADVGTYTDSLSLSGLTLTGEKAGNYTLADDALGDIKVTKANLTITIGNADTTYGTAFDEKDYGYILGGVVNGDTDAALKGTINGASGGYVNAGAAGGTNGRVTGNAGEYSLGFGNDLVGENILQNYDITTVTDGKATVNKADLTIQIGNADTTYGTAFDEKDYGYILGGVVNGDTDAALKGTIDRASGGYENTGAADGTNGRVTEDAGEYTLGFGNKLVGENILQNYNITTVSEGKVTVNKANLTIGADSVEAVLGSAPDYSGTDINGALVNGDTLGNYGYGVYDSAIEQVLGVHERVIGLWIDGVFYGLSGSDDWTSAAAFFRNYRITATPGTLTVIENTPDYQWNGIYHEAPFDRMRNFRERKAEIHFIAGGMTV